MVIKSFFRLRINSAGDLFFVFRCGNWFLISIDSNSMYSVGCDESKLSFVSNFGYCFFKITFDLHMGH